jgi:hypothetical protein
VFFSSEVQKSPLGEIVYCYVSQIFKRLRACPFSYSLRSKVSSLIDGGGLFFPGDFLEGEGCAQEVFGELAAAFDVVGGDGFFSSVEIEAAVLPIEKVTGFLFGEEFAGDKGLDEVVAEEFGEGVEGLCGGSGEKMEESGLVEESAGAENVKIRVKYEVIAEGLDACDGGEFALAGGGHVELDTHQSRRDSVAVRNR